MRRLLLASCLALGACTPTGAAVPDTTAAAPSTTAPSTTTTTPPTTSTIKTVPPTTTTEAPPVFTAAITTLTAEELGSSWRPDCPVDVEDVRRIELTHWTMGGDTGTGLLDVHVDVADEVVAVFAALFELGFPVERMEPVDVFDGDDDRSMAANNTSGLNCRPIAGTSRWSQHAYGLAIDVNPVQNPWIPGLVHPPAGADYLDRSDVRPGMITDEVVAAFAAAGWGWGGRWNAPDYHHFSKTGR